MPTIYRNTFIHFILSTLLDVLPVRQFLYNNDFQTELYSGLGLINGIDLFYNHKINSEEHTTLKQKICDYTEFSAKILSCVLGIAAYNTNWTKHFLHNHRFIAVLPVVIVLAIDKGLDLYDFDDSKATETDQNYLDL